MFVLRFWIFAAILKLLKLRIVVKLHTYLNNEYFDILHDFVSQLVSPVMFVLWFLTDIIVLCFLAAILKIWTY